MGVPASGEQAEAPYGGLEWKNASDRAWPSPPADRPTYAEAVETAARMVRAIAAYSAPTEPAED